MKRKPQSAIVRDLESTRGGTFWVPRGHFAETSSTRASQKWLGQEEVIITLHFSMALVTSK